MILSAIILAGFVALPWGSILNIVKPCSRDETRNCKLSSLAQKKTKRWCWSCRFFYPGNGQIWTVPPFQAPSNQWVKLGPKLTTHQPGRFHSPNWFIAHMPYMPRRKIGCCSCCSHIGGWSWTGYFFHSVGNFIIPTDFHSMFFQRGRAQPPTSQSYQSMNRDL